MSIRSKIEETVHRPVRLAALVVVAITSIYVMVMGWRINEVLSGPDWCSRALNADKLAPSAQLDGMRACVGLLTIQLKSLATNSHILFGTVALCLGVLVVIVLAGARLAGKIADIVDVNVSKDAGEAAQQTADAAQDTADAISGERP